MTDSSNYWSRFAGKRHSRRTVLRGAGAMGGGLLGAALIGCSDDSDDPEGTTPAGTGTTPAGTGTAEASGEPKRGGIFRSTAVSDPPTLDPYTNASVDTKSFAAHVYSRLYKIDTDPDQDPFDLLPVPDLAEGAETEDGQHWVVKLRQGAKFHNLDPVNGREVTTEDVLFSWGRLSAPESPNSTQAQEITDVQAVDDHTLQFTLVAPSPTFLETIGDANLLWIQPTEADGGFDPALTPIGSGPWILEKYEVASRRQYGRHPEYFVDGLPYMDGVEDAVIPEYANAKTQFEAGNIHNASINSQDILDMRDRDPSIQWLRSSSIGLAWMAFSGADVDPDAVWRDERFRQAVSMTLDRDGLNELAGNVSQLREAGLDASDRWNNIQPASFGSRFWLDPKSEGQGPSSQYFQYNPEEARELFDAIGLPPGAVPYLYTSRYGTTFQSVAEAQGNMLTDGGLNVQTQVQDYSSQYITQTFLGNFSGIVYGLESSLTPGAYVERLFGEDSANHGRVRDEEITRLHEQQRVELDEEARREQIYQIQRRNGEMMFYAPAQSSSVSGWVAYQGTVRDVSRTRGYGVGTEVLAKIWLDE
ncbi:MAG: hypothetical protein GEU80_03710 [Dehalococcoidia bacterium]|nr:hypothetical protein [Dehalococcoidia bacterium]